MFRGVGRTFRIIEGGQELFEWNYDVTGPFDLLEKCSSTQSPLHTDVYDIHYSTYGPRHPYTGHTAQRPGRCVEGPWSGIGSLAVRFRFYK